MGSRRDEGPLAAGNAHVARDGRASRFDLELMPFWLTRQQPIERVVDRPRSPVSKEVAKLHLLIMAEASKDSPGRGDPDPVAAFAEVMRQRRDQAEADR